MVELGKTQKLGFEPNLNQTTQSNVAPNSNQIIQSTFKPMLYLNWTKLTV